MGLSKTALYYRSHPEARKKHQAYNAKVDKTPAKKKKRAEIAKYRKNNNVKKGMDVGHTKNGMRQQKPSANRGSKSNMPGDRRARGGKKSK